VAQVLALLVQFSRSASATPRGVPFEVADAAELELT
jgi:hypothetical protein